MTRTTPSVIIPAPIAFTATKYTQLQADLLRLQEERKAVIARLQTAREMGDLSENGAYIYAKRELGSTDRLIRQTQHFIKYGKVIQTTTQTNKVSIGHQVTVELDGKTFKYILIGTQEADPLTGRVSTMSPLGKALLGKAVGQTATVTTPRGEVNYLITDITVAQL